MSEILEAEIGQWIYNAQQSVERIKELSEAIEKFLTHPYQAHNNKWPTIWQKDSSSLLDYSNNPKTSDDQVMLFIPSFINQPYILDLLPENSFLNYFAIHKSVFMLDWGQASAIEKEYSISHYITERLLPAIDFLSGKYKQIILVGYCLGGLAALAAAQLKKQQISKLILMATPWDFAHFKHPAENFTMISEMILTSQENVSSNLMRNFFYNMMPIDRIYKKFFDFVKNLHDRQKSRLFVATERWAMDEMLISRGVFQECFRELIQENKLLKGNWKVAEKLISPRQIKTPTMIVMPEQDIIVPPSSQNELLKIRNHRVLLPKSGHVGMIIGEKSCTQLREPLLNWINE